MSRTYKDAHRQPRLKSGSRKPDLKAEKQPKRIVKPKTKASVRRKRGE